MMALPLTDAQALDLIQRLTTANPELSAFAQQYAFLGEHALAEDEAGRLAQELLAVLGESPQQAARIDALLLTPSAMAANRMAVPTLLAAVFLMRDRVRFRRRDDGAWAPLIDQRPTDSPALTQLLGRLGPLLPSASGMEEAG